MVVDDVLYIMAQVTAHALSDAAERRWRRVFRIVSSVFWALLLVVGMAFVLFDLHFFGFNYIVGWGFVWTGAICLILTEWTYRLRRTRARAVARTRKPVNSPRH